MNNIRKARLKKGLKMQEVADYLCCQPNVYGRYENGAREPSTDIWLKLSSLFKEPVDYLMGNIEVFDTSVTEAEAAMVKAMRRADDRACEDALAILEIHDRMKK